MIDLDNLIREADPARDLSVPPAASSQIARPSDGRGRPPRRLADALAAGAAVVVAIAVALIVLLAGSHGRSQVSTAGRSSIPAPARPLVGILGVLRRPQTAADRAVESRVRGPRVVVKLIRLAAVAPWGQQAMFVPMKAVPSDTLMLFTSLVATGHSVITFSGPITASMIESGRAWSEQRAGRSVRLTMVVPDGVAKVAFVVEPKGVSPGFTGWTAYAPLEAKVVTVSVHGNVAFAQIPRDCCASNPITRWYAGDGRLIKETGNAPTARTGRSTLGPPAINLPPGVVTVARLRAGGKPFRLTLQRIRFEGRQYVCLYDNYHFGAGSGSGGQCRGPLPLPARPLVAVEPFPTVCTPHPVQLVWGLALSDVRVALQVGGRAQLASRRPIPSQLHVPGNLFYVWARSAPGSLVARTNRGTLLAADAVNPPGAPAFGAICKQLKPGGQVLQTSQG